jgi:hypothetical protein
MVNRRAIAGGVGQVQVGSDESLPPRGFLRRRGGSRLGRGWDRGCG